MFVVSVATMCAALTVSCSSSDNAPIASALPSPFAESTGDVHYVSPDGSDDADGTEDHPWLTIQHAVDETRSGETVMLRAGTYADWTSWESQSGTQDAPITLRSYPGERAVVTGSLRIISSWVRIRDVTFQGGTSANDREVLLFVSGGDHIDIVHNEFFGSMSSAIFLGEGDNTADDVRIRANHIYENGDDSNFDHGVYCGHARGALIENNVVEHNTAYGLQLYPDCDDALVTNNTIVANGRAGIIVGGNSEVITENARVVNNIVTDNDEGVVGYWPGEYGSGNRVERNLIAANRDSNLQGRLRTAGNMVASPRFVDPNGRDYRLELRSQAVDSAISAFSPQTDFDDRARPQGERADLGAFETS
jgi:hypothetical protein